MLLGAEDTASWDGRYCFWGRKILLLGTEEIASLFFLFWMTDSFFGTAVLCSITGF